MFSTLARLTPLSLTRSRYQINVYSVHSIIQQLIHLFYSNICTCPSLPEIYLFIHPSICSTLLMYLVPVAVHSPSIYPLSMSHPLSHPCFSYLNPASTHTSIPLLPFSVALSPSFHAPCYFHPAVHSIHYPPHPYPPSSPRQLTLLVLLEVEVLPGEGESADAVSLLELGVRGLNGVEDEVVEQEGPPEGLQGLRLPVERVGGVLGDQVEVGEGPRREDRLGFCRRDGENLGFVEGGGIPVRGGLRQREEQEEEDQQSKRKNEQ